VGTPDVIRASRLRQRLTQAELAREIGVDTRQINRYESGETEPTLAVARRLADRLRITMDELAGGQAPLNGSWAFIWQGLSEIADTHSGMVELSLRGRHLGVRPLRSPLSAESETVIAWSAELFVDIDTLLGGYKIETVSVGGRGLLNLNHHDGLIDGDWIRTSVRNSGTGKLCLARNPDMAEARLHELLDT